MCGLVRPWIMPWSSVEAWSWCVWQYVVSFTDVHLWQCEWVGGGSCCDVSLVIQLFIVLLQTTGIWGLFVLMHDDNCSLESCSIMLFYIISKYLTWVQNSLSPATVNCIILTALCLTLHSRTHSFIRLVLTFAYTDRHLEHTDKHIHTHTHTYTPW